MIILIMKGLCQQLVKVMRVNIIWNQASVYFPLNDLMYYPYQNSFIVVEQQKPSRSLYTQKRQLVVSN